MKSSGVKDTTAYKIVRQIVDHVYGSDEKISGEDFVFVHHAYIADGGSWEKLMAGDMGCVKILEDVLERFVKDRRLKKIATKVAFF